MPRSFTGKCWTCGGQGHRARECLNSQHQQQAPLTTSDLVGIFVGGSGHPAAHEPQAATAPQASENVKMEPGLESPVSTVAGAAENIKKEPGLESLAVTVKSEQTARGIEMGLGQMAGYSAQAIQRAQAHLAARRPGQLNIVSVPVVGRGDRPLQQAGRGALPGARNAQPNQPGSGVLGNSRVARPGAGRRGRGRRDPVWEDEDEERRRRGARRDPIELGDEELPRVQDGGSSVEQHQRDQPTHSQKPRRAPAPTAPSTVVGFNLTAQELVSLVHDTVRPGPMQSSDPQHLLTSTRPATFVGSNFTPEQVVAMADQAIRTQPQGTRWNVQLEPVPPKDCADSSWLTERRFPSASVKKGRPGNLGPRPVPVNPEDVAASTELIKGRFLGALVTNGDLFKLHPNQGVEMEDEADPTADEAMDQQHRK